MSTSYLVMCAILTVAAAARGTWSPCGLSMVSAINPMSERGRGCRYWLTTCWFIAGSVLGGALLGGVTAGLAWLARPLTGPAAALIATLGCLIVLAADLRVGGVSLPLHPRQVNERWLTQYRRWLYASGFGFQIGTGFATYIMTAATYLIALLASVSGRPAFAFGIGLLFGLVRGSAVLLSSRCRNPDSLRALHRRLSRLEPASLRAVVSVELVSAGVLGSLAVGTAGALVAFGAALALVLAARPRPDLLGRPTPSTPVPQQSGR
ncbi:MAG: hypothetical protein ABI140_21315 [Jatrophihabitantaceae bacterium]